MMTVTKNLIFLAVITLAACGPAAQPDGNSATVENVAKRPPDQCTPPTLVLADGAWPSKSTLLDEIIWNFDTAYHAVCSKGLMGGKSLIDAKAADQGHIFLINAPEANVASIYLSDVDGSRMVLEYPFLTTDGKSQVPSTDELEEAIYCAVVGATPEEQESTGRCLVD